MILVLMCFITSSDPWSLANDTAGGKTETPTSQRAFWATTEGIVAIVLLVGGGLTALRW